jgi:hypothetical protein
MEPLMHKTVEIHALLVAALFVAFGCLAALLLIMLHVHAGDVAYISHMRHPIIVVPARAGASISV